MAYFFMGHGNEYVEEERQTVPDGITLVTITECGFETRGAEIESFMRLLSDNYEISIKEPTVLPDEHLRIYKAGEEMPTLSASFLMDFIINKNDALLCKSGVFKLPLLFDWETMEIDETILIHPEMGGYIDNTTGVVDKLYEGAVFPPREWLETIKRTYTDSLIPRYALLKPFKLTDIFEFIGPGIYYFGLCRAVDPPISLFNYSPVPNDLRQTYNSAEYIRHYLKQSKRPKDRKLLERTLFTIEKVIRPRSKSRHTKVGGVRCTRKKINRKLKHKL
jgi:hypothetical protein